jgi:hypothetical protein
LTAEDVRKLKQFGEQAALTGTLSFTDISDIIHSDEAKAEYEKAYQGTLRNLSVKDISPAYSLRISELCLRSECPNQQRHLYQMV